jgi:excisionase family DNA binding protein
LTRLEDQNAKKYEERSSKQLSELLTVSEVADILRVDDTTVRRWVKQGTLEAIVLPHTNARQAYRIKRETLNRVLGEEQPVNA